MKKIVFKLFAIVACFISISANEFRNSLDCGVVIATRGQGDGAGAADIFNDGYIGKLVPAGGAIDINPYVDEEGHIVFWMAQDTGQGVQKVEIDKDLSYEIRMQFGNIVFAPFELEELVDVLGELLEEDEANFLNILGKRSESEGAGCSSNLSKRHTSSAKDKAYSCDVADCDYETNWKCNLKRHKESDHEGVTYPCDVAGCDYEGRRKGHLKAHKEAMHVGIAYSCDVTGCTYRATNKSNLKKHKEAKHEGLIYPCDVTGCDYKATQRRNLKKHKKSKH